MLTPEKHSLFKLVQCIEKDDLSNALDILKMIVEAKKKSKVRKTISKNFHQNKVVGSTIAKKEKK